MGPVASDWEVERNAALVDGGGSFMIASPIFGMFPSVRSSLIKRAQRVNMVCAAAGEYDNSNI